MTTRLDDIVRDVQLWVQMQPKSWQNEAYRSVKLLPNLLDDEYKRIFGSSTFSIVEANSLILAAIASRKNLVRQIKSEFENTTRVDDRFLQHNFKETT